MRSRSRRCLTRCYARESLYYPKFCLSTPQTPAMQFYDITILPEQSPEPSISFVFRVHHRSTACDLNSHLSNRLWCRKTSPPGLEKQCWQYKTRAGEQYAVMRQYYIRYADFSTSPECDAKSPDGFGLEAVDSRTSCPRRQAQCRAVFAHVLRDALKPGRRGSGVVCSAAVCDGRAVQER